MFKTYKIVFTKQGILQYTGNVGLFTRRISKDIVLRTQNIEEYP